MTMEDALTMIVRGETEEQFKKRTARIRRLANERDALEDAIEILGEDPTDERIKKKQARLAKVLAEIDRLL